MTINSSINSVNVRPEKPAAPLAPPGGNIENRQPPSEPLPPVQLSDNSSSKGEKGIIINNSDNLIDVFV